MCPSQENYTCICFGGVIELINISYKCWPHDGCMHKLLYLCLENSWFGDLHLWEHVQEWESYSWKDWLCTHICIQTGSNILFSMKMLINSSSTLTWLEVSVNEQFALHCCLPLLVIFHMLKWRSFGKPPLIKVVNIQKGSAPTVLLSSPIMQRISCTFNGKNPNFHSTYCSWNGPSQELPLGCSNCRWTDFTKVMGFGIFEVMKQNYSWLGFVGVFLWKVS